MLVNEFFFPPFSPFNYKFFFLKFFFRGQKKKFVPCLRDNETLIFLTTFFFVFKICKLEVKLYSGFVSINHLWNFPEEASKKKKMMRRYLFSAFFCICLPTYAFQKKNFWWGWVFKKKWKRFRCLTKSRPWHYLHTKINQIRSPDRSHPPFSMLHFFRTPCLNYKFPDNFLHESIFMFD